MGGNYSNRSFWGVVSTTMLTTTNVSANQFQTVAFVSQYLNDEHNKNENIILVANPIYSLIFKYLFDKDHILNDLNGFLYYKIKTDKILLIAHHNFREKLRSDGRFGIFINNTEMVATFNGYF